MNQARTDSGPKPIRVENLTRGQTLVSAGCAADNAWTKLRGLIGSRPLAQGEGLLIPGSQSIHTHFMSFPIDVAYVDSAGKVIGLHHAIRPWRFGQFHLRSRLVVEMPAGTLKATGTQLGDQLQVHGYQF